MRESEARSCAPSSIRTLRPPRRREGGQGGRQGGRSPIVGDREDIDIRLEFVEAGSWEKRRNELLSETNTQTELKNSVVWLVRQEEQVDDLLPEVVRSEQVVSDPNLEHEADRDVAQFLRAERRLAEISREQAGKILEQSLLDGTLFFRGKPAPAAEAGKTIEAAARTVLGKAAKDVFPHFHLVPIHPPTNAAARFLGVERLDRITKEIDPSGLVSKKGGAPRVDVNHPALAEVLRAFRAKADESGSGVSRGTSCRICSPRRPTDGPRTRSATSSPGSWSRGRSNCTPLEGLSRPPGPSRSKR